MSGLKSTHKRERALRIRELAIGFNDDTSRAMLELAMRLEARAAAEEASRADGDDPEPSGEVARPRRTSSISGVPL
jgi:hypothetical protein